MSTPSVGIVQTGVANTASVRAAIRRAGIEPTFVDDPTDVDTFDRVILPGVGAFAAGMERLGEDGLIEPLRQRIDEGRPTMLVCLGMQLLCASSEESPGVDGLGVIDARVTSFPGKVSTPQFGWNTVKPEGDPGFLREGYAYFANSYRLARPPDGWSYALTDHGGPFVSALERGAVLAVQFHPELSGSYGQTLIERWLEHAGVTT